MGVEERLLCGLLNAVETWHHNSSPNLAALLWSKFGSIALVQIWQHCSSPDLAALL
jgi:hypothetical protein